MTRSIQTTSKMAPSSLLLSTALAACTVGPDYTPPKAELAPFHNLVNASTPQAHSARPLDRWRDRQSRGLLWPRCPAKPRSVLQASSAAFGNEGFNDDCLGFNDLLIWAFSRIRANCPSHSAKQNHWVICGHAILDIGESLL
jgi:hypothetical protein